MILLSYAYDWGIKMIKVIKSVLIVLVLLVLTGCVDKYDVTFLDMHENVILVRTVESGQNAIPPQAPKEDNHTFVGWIGNYDNVTSDRIIRANYELIQHEITFLDSDGETLKVMSVLNGELPLFDLPSDNDAWKYLDWYPEVIEATEDAKYIATRELKPEFFYGNVFQLIVYDLGRRVIGAGTGFVVDRDGTFITNAHVMQGGYFAEAIFEIPNPSRGSRYTTIEINQVLHIDREKDFFIGRMEGYRFNPVFDVHFRKIPFTLDHQIGDITFSVGYPHSVTDLEIHQGVIVRDIASLRDKIFTGVRYIGSTSYLAPGSSGGILLNNNLEILGITSIGTYEDGIFELGGTIETLNFNNVLSNRGSLRVSNYAHTMHPDEIVFIDYFKRVSEDPRFRREEFWTFTRYIREWSTEDVNDSDLAYIYDRNLIVDSDNWISYSSEIYWESGQRRTVKLEGYFSHTNGINDMSFELTYTYANGRSFTVKSNQINYSENLDLTLNRVSTSSTGGFSISESNLEYTRRIFNAYYGNLYNWIFID